VHAPRPKARTEANRRHRGKLGTRYRSLAARQIVLDAEAGQVSAELGRGGVAAHERVHVVVELPDATDLPMAALAQTGKAFDWLDDEPDLYSDADLVTASR